MSVLRNEFFHYTYEDYIKVPEGDEKLELIDGEIVAMASPTWRHQEIVTTFIASISNHLKEKGSKCKVLSDVDTRLNYAKGDDTAVRPDILMVCDRSKFDEKSIKGAPDFIVEILSPSTAKRDMKVKLIKYCEAGVKEVWIIDPVAEIVLTYVLNPSGSHDWSIYGAEDEIPVSVLENFYISGSDIFPEDDIPEEEKL